MQTNVSQSSQGDVLLTAESAALRCSSLQKLQNQLPRRVVRTHPGHLIDTEFEIATSANATPGWQGRLAPLRKQTGVNTCSR